MKRKIFYFICDIMKVEEGAMPPEWLMWLFFPMLKNALNFTDIKYNPRNRVYDIHGVKISEYFFRELGEGGMPEGGIFKLIKRHEDGTISIERMWEMEG